MPVVIEKDGISIYENPESFGYEMRTPFEFFKLMFTETREKIPKEEILDKTLPVIKPDLNLLSNPPKDKIQTMWIGHATAFFQFDGLNVIIDPVFSNYCSPVQFAGPKRYRPVPLPLSEFPTVDLCFISHNHYVPLDYNSVLELGKKK